MSLQILSAVPLGPECTRISVYVGASVCSHLWNTGLCIIYQTAVSFVLLFTLRARSRANRDPSQQEWQSQKQFNWRLKQLIMPSLSLQCNYSSMRRCLTWLICSNTMLMPLCQNWKYLWDIGFVLIVSWRCTFGKLLLFIKLPQAVSHYQQPGSKIHIILLWAIWNHFHFFQGLGKKWLQAFVVVQSLRWI